MWLRLSSLCLESKQCQIWLGNGTAPKGLGGLTYPHLLKQNPAANKGTSTMANQQGSSQVKKAGILYEPDV